MQTCNVLGSTISPPTFVHISHVGTSVSGYMSVYMYLIVSVIYQFIPSRGNRKQIMLRLKIILIFSCNVNHNNMTYYSNVTSTFYTYIIAIKKGYLKLDKYVVQRGLKNTCFCKLLRGSTAVCRQQ